MISKFSSLCFNVGHMVHSSVRTSFPKHFYYCLRVRISVLILYNETNNNPKVQFTLLQCGSLLFTLQFEPVFRIYLYYCLMVRILWTSQIKSLIILKFSSFSFTLLHCGSNKCFGYLFEPSVWTLSETKNNKVHSISLILLISE